MKIDPEDLEITRRIIRTYAPEYEVRAFGSRVHGRHVRKFSDLDLVVMTDKPIDIWDIKEAFVESDLQFKVDVVDWASTKPDFRAIIEKEYEIVQPAPAS